MIRAEITFKETNFYDRLYFLAQQAVEKYLKAIIVISKGEIITKEKTHNLIYLAKICKNIIDLKDFESYLRKLTSGYILARYPVNAYAKFNKVEARECLECAKEIIKFIKNKVGLSIYYKWVIFSCFNYILDCG